MLSHWTDEIVFFPLLLLRKNLKLLITNNKFFLEVNLLSLVLLTLTTICFVSYTYSVFNEHLFSSFLFFSEEWKVKSEEVNFIRSAKEILVGPSGLEPPTSCLSGTRSNLLSYDPLWFVSSKWSFFTWIFRVKGRFKLPSSLCQHWAIFPYSFP